MLFLISVRGHAPLSKTRFWSAKWKWQQNLFQPILSVCITYLHGKPELFSLGLLSLRLNNRPPGNSQLMCLFIHMLLFIKMHLLFIISPYRRLRQWNLHCAPDSRLRNDPPFFANPILAWLTAGCHGNFHRLSFLHESKRPSKVMIHYCPALSGQWFTNSTAHLPHSSRLIGGCRISSCEPGHHLHV